MAAIKMTYKRKGSNTESWLGQHKEKKVLKILSKYGEQGVKALSEATPKDTGLTAASWRYEINKNSTGYELYWCNSNTIDKEVTTLGGRNHDPAKVHTRVDHIPVVILIQYGHGTGTGGYVQGRDFINPAIRPIFDAIANDAFLEVNKS